MKIGHEQGPRPSNTFDHVKSTAMAASNAGVGNLAISDVHFGAGVCHIENVYDVKVAARRTIQAFDDFLGFMKYQTNGSVYSTCVIWFPGDIIEGHHEKLVKNAPGAENAEDPSKNAATYAFLVYTQLKRLAEAGASDIVVLGTPGNHGRKERGEVDFGGAKNYDIDFFFHLKARCDALNEASTQCSIQVTFPGCNDNMPAEESVLSVQHGRPFILCHGDEAGFQLKGKHKTGNRFGKNEVRAAAMVYRECKVAHYKQRVRSRAKQGQDFDEDWDTAMLVHGHWHVGCAAPDEHVISCGSLRGIDDYANELQAVVELEEPSAMCWAVRTNGSLSTVQKIDVDAWALDSIVDAPSTPFKLIEWGPSPKVQQQLRSRAYG